jgi:hypothetical protein
MKNETCLKWMLGLAFVTLPLVGGCRPEPAKSPEVAAPSITPAQEAAGAATPAPAAPAPAATLPGAEQESGQPDISAAAFKPVSKDVVFPENLKLGGPASEVAKMAGSGVEEGIMLTYVTNSPSTFNLTADQIIYLNDIGVPEAVVTAMIQRDQQFRQGAMSAAVPAPVQEPAAAAPQPTEQAVAAPDLAPPPHEATQASFYNALNPYGTWVDVEGYGYCWQPNVVVLNPYWRPYFDGGRWIYTDCGWYWMSDYSWGWAPFHYGRWFRHHRLGWCWYPDTVWGPSWVSWRYYDTYCGWAPLPPAARFTAGFGFTYYGSSVAVGFGFGLGWDAYCFIPTRHFRDHHLHRYAVAPHEVNRFYNRTVVINKIEANRTTIINHGIPAERIASATRTEVPRVAIREVNRTPTGVRPERLAANGRTVTVYKPEKPQVPAHPSLASDPGRASVRQPGAPVASPARTTTIQPTRTETARTRTSAPSVATPSLSRPVPAKNPNRDFSAYESVRPRSSAPAVSQPHASPSSRSQGPATTGRSERSPGTATMTPPTTAPASGSSAVPRAPSRSTTTWSQQPAVKPFTAPTGSVPQSQTPSSRSVTVPPSSQERRPSSPTWSAPRGSERGRPDQSSPSPRLDSPKTKPLSWTEMPPAVNPQANAFAPSYNAPARSSSAYQAPPRYSQAPAPSLPTYQAPARVERSEVPRYSSSPSRSAPSYSAPSGPSHSYASRPSGSESRSAPAPQASSSPSRSESRSDSSDRSGSSASRGRPR